MTSFETKQERGRASELSISRDTADAALAFAGEGAVRATVNASNPVSWETRVRVRGEGAGGVKGVEGGWEGEEVEVVGGGAVDEVEVEDGAAVASAAIDFASLVQLV